MRRSVLISHFVVDITVLSVNVRFGLCEGDPAGQYTLVRIKKHEFRSVMCSLRWPGGGVLTPLLTPY